MVPLNANLFTQHPTDGAISKHYHLGLCSNSVRGWSTSKFWVHMNKKTINSDRSLSCRWFNWPSVNIALAFSSHLGVQNSWSWPCGKGLLCKSQINSKNTRVSQTIDREGRWQDGRGDHYGSFDCIVLLFYFLTIEILNSFLLIWC